MYSYRVINMDEIRNDKKLDTGVFLALIHAPQSSHPKGQTNRTQIMGL